jgi:hypothetical protein
MTYGNGSSVARLADLDAFLENQRMLVNSVKHPLDC